MPARRIVGNQEQLGTDHDLQTVRRAITGRDRNESPHPEEAALLGGRPEALEGRRMATDTAEQVAILRDAPLRSGAPQDEVRLFRALQSERSSNHLFSTGAQPMTRRLLDGRLSRA